jgi:hypothetical protein
MSNDNTQSCDGAYGRFKYLYKRMLTDFPEGINTDIAERAGALAISAFIQDSPKPAYNKGAGGGNSYSKPAHGGGERKERKPLAPYNPAYDKGEVVSTPQFNLIQKRANIREGGWDDAAIATYCQKMFGVTRANLTKYKATHLLDAILNKTYAEATQAGVAAPVPAVPAHVSQTPNFTDDDIPF